MFLPHREVIRQIPGLEQVWFWVWWESWYLYAGTGPWLEPNVVAGVAALGAMIDFDIYAIDRPAGSEE